MVEKTDTHFGIWHFSYGFFGFGKSQPYNSVTENNTEIFGTTTLNLTFEVSSLNLIFGATSSNSLLGTTSPNSIFGTTSTNQF